MSKSKDVISKAHPRNEFGRTKDDTDLAEYKTQRPIIFKKVISYLLSQFDPVKPGKQ